MIFVQRERAKCRNAPSMSDEFLTEAILEASRNLDRRSVEAILEVIHAEDRRALEAVTKILPRVAEAAEILILVLGGGGRWFNVGAGTSGRMGVLDAAEIPPTFGYPPERIQGIIAGGAAALSSSIEGAEDDEQAAVEQLREAGLVPGDAVVAISASGRTPFARAALEEAREIGARRIAISCDPRSPLARAAEVSLAPIVGPEVIAGSTRMKGGLVQKMILHLLSTTVMVRLGRVEGNEMSCLIPVSQKLRRRAVRIVRSLAEVDESVAEEHLDANHGSVEDAVATIRQGRRPDRS